MAQDGHHVILHGRKPEKLAQVLEEIKTENPAAEVAGFVADFAKLDEVRRMAKEVQDAYPTIDVLINNAGVFNSPVTQAANGLEVRYVVNYFAPYVLSQALLPQLQQSDKARIVNLSSAAQAPVNYEVLQGQIPAQSARDARLASQAIDRCGERARLRRYLDVRPAHHPLRDRQHQYAALEQP